MTTPRFIIRRAAGDTPRPWHLIDTHPDSKPFFRRTAHTECLMTAEAILFTERSRPLPGAIYADMLAPQPDGYGLTLEDLRPAPMSPRQAFTVAGCSYTMEDYMEMMNNDPGLKALSALMQENTERNLRTYRDLTPKDEFLGLLPTQFDKAIAREREIIVQVSGNRAGRLAVTPPDLQQGTEEDPAIARVKKQLEKNHERDHTPVTDARYNYLREKAIKRDRAALHARDNADYQRTQQETREQRRAPDTHTRKFFRTLARNTLKWLTS